jgi:hypothetical protein
MDRQASDPPSRGTSRGAVTSPRSGHRVPYTCVSHETRVQRPLLHPTEGPLRGAPAHSRYPVDLIPEPGDPCPGLMPNQAGAGGWSTANSSGAICAPNRPPWTGRWFSPEVTGGGENGPAPNTLEDLTRLREFGRLR